MTIVVIFIPQFDRIYAENNIISFYISVHSLYILQSFDIEYFAVLKHIYSRFISDLACMEYNYIDKLDFLEDYQCAQLEAFQSDTIQNSFVTNSLVPPINAERVLSKLNISLRISIPSNSRLSSRSSQFTPKTPRTVIQLQKQTFSLKQLLKQQSNSPPTPSNRIIKNHYLALHNTALLAQDNTNLHTANKKKRQKHNRSHRQIPHQGGLSVEEDLLLAEQLNQEEEAGGVVSHAQNELPNQADPPRTRAPPMCSGCGVIGHKINKCKNR
ncbi:hypothetical protein N7450_003269 [Penicillium hetheringtonii]|uniref:CCHC-type domain-containing protein n=1 Tax=Penicillium hetheringtonii TaxID=911720 RepID=A0AAD6DXF8_9EURO|nr:hypothetical protein N7450_003269 [Penicillium hetheringtonii]